MNIPKSIEISLPSRDKEHFLRLATAASKLKKYARVSLNIADLAEKSFYEMPAGGSGWHEYTAYKPSIFHFFPHEKIAKHIPESHVHENVELLRAKVKILEELDLGAYVFFQEPYFLPESFFVEYPHLRGPRVDHPGRSTEPAFAMCMDQKESLEMTTQMVASLCNVAPMLNRYNAQTNDAGSGFCWSDYSYPGKNGPPACQTKCTSKRMKGFLEAIHAGAKETIGDIPVRLTGNLSRFESDGLLSILPPLTEMGTKGRSTGEVIGSGSMMGTENFYPVIGVLNPYNIINSVASWASGDKTYLSLNFADGYGRGADSIETFEKTIEVVIHVLENLPKDRIERLQCLKSLAVKWAGDAFADDLLEAWVSLQEAQTVRKASAGSFSSMYEGVSARHITRPLVLKPENLSPEEDSYAIKHLFDSPKKLGKSIYNYSNGTKSSFTWNTSWYWIGPFQRSLSLYKSIASTFEKIGTDKNNEWFHDQSRGLRIFASIQNSINHFNFAQVFLDKNREALSLAPVDDPNLSTSPKPVNSAQWYEILRTELENVNELIGILKNGGLTSIVVAKSEEDEDCWILGHDLINQLEKKAKVMTEHWRDLEFYVNISH